MQQICIDFFIIILILYKDARLHHILDSVSVHLYQSCVVVVYLYFWVKGKIDNRVPQI